MPCLSLGMECIGLVIKRTRTNWDKKERRTKDMTTKFPLRTKRKMETRLKLVRSARHLFLTKGYDNTTLEEVAEAAGLHVQTLYRHFGTKQDLAKAGDEYWLRLFEEAISKIHEELKDLNHEAGNLAAMIEENFKRLEN